MVEPIGPFERVAKTPGMVRPAATRSKARLTRVEMSCVRGPGSHALPTRARQGRQRLTGPA